MARKREATHEQQAEPLTQTSSHRSEDQEHKHVSERKGRAKKRASEDEANTESQQLGALRGVLKKPKGKEIDIQRFRTRVEGEQWHLRELLQQRLQQAEKADECRRNAIATTISEALLGPPTDDRNTRGKAADATFSGTAIATNPAFMYAANLIQASRDVVNHYEKISEKMDATVLTREKHITKAWEQDVYNTARKLEVGHRKALKNVKKVLGMDDGQEEMNRVEKVDQGVEGDSEGDGEMPHTPVNYGLHNALRYTERGVKRMVKGLPKDASI